LINAINSFKEESLEDFIEKTKQRSKEDLVESLRKSLYQNHQYRVHIENLSREYKSLKIDQERMQRDKEELKLTLMNSVPSVEACKDIKPIGEEGKIGKGSSTELKSKKLKTILMNTPLPSLPNTKPQKYAEECGIPNGRGGVSKALNFQGKTMFY
jgi:hypothetical protein